MVHSNSFEPSKACLGTKVSGCPLCAWIVLSAMASLTAPLPWDSFLPCEFEEQGKGLPKPAGSTTSCRDTTWATWQWHGIIWSVTIHYLWGSSPKQFQLAKGELFCQAARRSQYKQRDRPGQRNSRTEPQGEWHSGEPNSIINDCQRCICMPRALAYDALVLRWGPSKVSDVGTVTAGHASLSSGCTDTDAFSKF